MTIEEAFNEIKAKLKSASERGIKPSIKVSGKDWVCTLEDKLNKFNIIAREEELTLVTMEAKKGKPDVQRIHAPEYSQQAIINRIEEAVRSAYG